MNRIFPIIAALFALNPVACDTSDGPANADPALALRLFGPPGIDDPFSGVAWMKIVVSGSGLALPYAVTVPYAPGGKGSLDGIPFSARGETRQVTVEGWSDAGGAPGFLVSRARSSTVAVEEGAPALAADLFFARVNATLPLVTAQPNHPEQFLSAGRVGHTATATAGEVVIAGGGVFSDPAATWWNGDTFTALTPSIEVINRSTRTSSVRGTLLMPRVWHTGTALSSGQVILAGGYGADHAAVAHVELYNPPTVLDGRALRLPDLGTPRAAHTATLISDSERLILFVGGDAAGTWELWDPVRGSHGVYPLPDQSPRRHHTATVFYVSGRTEPAVLITGGETPTGVLGSAMMFDSVGARESSTKAFAAIAGGQSLPGGGRTQQSAVFIQRPPPATSHIYVTGGFTDLERKHASQAIDVFLPNEGRFHTGAAGFHMYSARGGHQAIVLPGNVVSISGGLGEEPLGAPIQPLKSLEVIFERLATNGDLNIDVVASWNPDGGTSRIPALPANRLGHRAVVVDGMALLVGGVTFNATTRTFAPLTSLTFYNPE